MAFRNYYEALYAPPWELREEDLIDFLDGLEFPKLTDAQKKALAAPITKAEIRSAIKDLPGLDGLPVEFYVTFSEQLVPPLKKLCHAALETGLLPLTTREALVISLLKNGRDPTDMSGYRPLSLLN